MPHRPVETKDSVAPTQSGDRVVALDVLRGFALLGILLVNIMSFSGISSGSHEWTGSVDQAVQEFIQFFARAKFLSLFAILFGVGFSIQIDRLAAQSDSGIWIYGRRLLILFLFGALHLLLDPAEVLALYAMCGALLLLFRRTSSKSLVLWALLILPLPYLHTAIVSSLPAADDVVQAPEEGGGAKEDLGEQVGDEDPESDSAVSWNPYVGARAVRVHSSGNLTEVVAYNVQFSINRWTSSWVSYLWMTVPLPLMLIGYFIGRCKILQRQHEEISLFRKSFWLGVGVGTAGTWHSGILFEQAAAGGWDPWLVFVASVLWVMSSLIMALGYAAGIVLLLQQDFWRAFLKPLQAVGRFALTNYLLQTLICTTIFYAYGLGLYGKVGPADVVLLALAIYLSQVVISTIWAHWFRFGPVEWLWRSVTYGQRQPIKEN